MLLIINGQKQEHADGITLGALLETLRLPLSGWWWSATAKSCRAKPCAIWR